FEELKDKWVTLQDGEAFRLYGPSASVSFDTDSEPGDVDYPGADKPDQTVNVESGPTVIEDPKRPGYVFQGWTIPNAGGTEAIDQDLVYQDETDGKWYVDASKLPDYAGEDGRVELTARWTSVISVDVPSSVTFYADVVTQGNESREGLASSAFGQSKVASQSEVGLRIVGLESKQVKGNGSTSLGASDLLKKADGSTVSGTDDKLFSLYPATGELEEDDLKDPDATSASKPAGAVDFSLDDILLEKSFAADEFTIPAGDTLSLGYRLNLQETDTELDYDKLSALSEGASASIANISYCFALNELNHDLNMSTSPLWVYNDDPSLGQVGAYWLSDIKEAALDFSARVPYSIDSDDLETIDNLLSSSPYWKLYKGLYEKDAIFHARLADGACLEMRIIGFCQSDDGSRKNGITFQSIGILTQRIMDNSVNSWNPAGWTDFPQLRTQIRSGGDFDPELAKILQENYGYSTARTPMNNNGGLSGPSACKVFILSSYEVFGYAGIPSLSWDNRQEAYPSSATMRHRYRYYADGGSTIKQFEGAPCAWWLRSAINSQVTWGSVGADGNMLNSVINKNCGVAPCFSL
ncbi:MAG: InlB B-repeat-containing protein, partial [Eggerthellaceae bacterium]|nr:InlB B-repeat-containing protein [Eggerthellaceae bacterium]